MTSPLVIKAFQSNSFLKFSLLSNAKVNQWVSASAKERFMIEQLQGLGTNEVFETNLGIPRVLAWLEQTIYAGLTSGDAKSWTAEFISAIPVGADLTGIWAKYAVWLLTDPKTGIIKFVEHDFEKYTMVENIARLYKQNCTDKATWWQTANASTADVRLTSPDFINITSQSAPPLEATNTHSKVNTIAELQAIAAYYAVCAAYAAAHVPCGSIYANYAAFTAMHAADATAFFAKAEFLSSAGKLTPIPVFIQSGAKIAAETKAYAIQGTKLLELLRAAK